jgi:hypothetical protein
LLHAEKPQQPIFIGKQVDIFKYPPSIIHQPASATNNTTNWSLPQFLRMAAATVPSPKGKGVRQL